ncbi:RNA polymerase sigma factor SigB [Pseudonocardia sp. Ae168_Ps1]|uniref:SigB/SigF/SigG family RNA polymerase sigma factor n=1 Tax=unclassified Pseudonocardia TaxID=2619320 RepID=UPI000969640C|nr:MULTISPECIES: SigB/SigF/SigG family RNA polymerase sigma factor [unclassified Pseudonocardia]OLL76039.1 RNA polymerase sigma factor SigB [Pseudonocardia sp. Ae150A_Ps1]OLL82038.1 RNA polymerase sigma factor SigB [Pseudonocardia sp. Ae168_Ps1]OLL83849.1 RNA polymerase sigma factor SigB [Pseudonocardia sp. Ae263_Ps1]OLL90110.1 RNA polymerase sigma factor SigB [Pseudonocardia sp. Ae356_Ps1]
MAEPDTRMDTATVATDDEYAHLDVPLRAFAAAPGDDPERAALREQLARGFHPVVRHIAGRYRHRGEPADDLEQVGAIGLLNALDRFDPEQGTPFLAYAVPTITGEIRRHFRDRTWSMRVPRRLKDFQTRMTRAQVELAVRHGRAPKVSELAEHLGTSREEVIEGLQAQDSYRSDSLDRLAGDTESPLGEIVGGADAGIGTVEDREALRPALRRLPERERTILLLRFFGNRTQTQIAEEVGLSQMHVSRLLARSLATLRRHLVEEPGGDAVSPMSDAG